jgi:hypothetical protein
MVAIKMRMVLLPVIAAGVLGFAVLAQVADATHPRPQSASPVRVSLVPAYSQCSAANRTHGPPLAFPSCNPPAQASSFVTVGTPDANGAAANSVGFMRIKVIEPQCCPTQDVEVTGGVSDVRCKTGTSACGNANARGGPDYTGELQMNSTIRITDHYNSTAAGGGTDPATVIDIPFPVNMTCGNTADTSIGGVCSISASLVAVGPPSPTVIRAVVELDQIEILDGGADGVMGTTPNTRFAVQGLFIP